VYRLCLRDQRRDSRSFHQQLQLQNDASIGKRCLFHPPPSLSVRREHARLISFIFVSRVFPLMSPIKISPRESARTRRCRVTIKEPRSARIEFEGRLEQSRLNQRVANPQPGALATYNPTSERGNMTVSDAMQRPRAYPIIYSEATDS